MQAEPTFLASTDPPPGGGAICIRIPRGQQHLDLVGFQGLAGSISGRPPLEATLGQPLLSQEIALTVITEYLQRCAAPVEEKEEGAGEGIFIELLATETSEAIDALSAINRLHRHQ